MTLIHFYFHGVTAIYFRKFTEFQRGDTTPSSVTAVLKRSKEKGGKQQSEYADSCMETGIIEEYSFSLEKEMAKLEYHLFWTNIKTRILVCM